MADPVKVAFDRSINLTVLGRAHVISMAKFDIEMRALLATNPEGDTPNAES